MVAVLQYAPLRKQTTYIEFNKSWPMLSPCAKSAWHQRAWLIGVLEKQAVFMQSRALLELLGYASALVITFCGFALAL